MKNILLWLALLYSWLMTSCIHLQYLPNTHQQTLFTSKGEHRIFGGLSSQTFLQTGDLQYAYAFSDKSCLQLNGSWTNARQDESRLWGGLLEAALGRYRYLPRRFAEADQPDGIVIEVYGGVSIGHYRNLYRDGTSSGSVLPPPITRDLVGRSEVSSLRLSLQPMIGLTTPNMDIGISARLAYLKMLSGKFYGNDSEAQMIYRNLLTQNQFFLIEPAFTLRIGGKNLKFQGQLGYSSIPANFGLNYYISCGMNYAFKK